MKLLLDECLPQEFRLSIAGHDVYTVGYLGWKGIKNGQLLARAANDGLDALVTTDQGIENQQNLCALPMTVIVLDSVSNDLSDLQPMVPGLLLALTKLSPTKLSPRMLVHISKP